MQGIISIIASIKENITVVSDYIYQQKINEALGSMNNMLNNFTELGDAISLREEIAEEQKQRYVDLLKEALAAMENRDYILMADILQYDMVDLLDSYTEALND